jgi:hypothetical protein
MRWRFLPLAVALLSAACGPATYPPNNRALLNAELTVRVRTALLNARDVDATKIDVRAIDGSVTLEGAVPSDDHEKRVVELVRQVPGVTRVTSKIEVPGKAAPTSRERRRPTARS